MGKLFLNGEAGVLIEYDVFLTTLESSVDGLTAGDPRAQEEFEQEIEAFLTDRTNKHKDKVIRLD